MQTREYHHKNYEKVHQLFLFRIKIITIYRYNIKLTYKSLTSIIPNLLLKLCNTFASNLSSNSFGSMAESLCLVFRSRDPQTARTSHIMVKKWILRFGSFVDHCSWDCFGAGTDRNLVRFRLKNGLVIGISWPVSYSRESFPEKFMVLSRFY